MQNETNKNIGLRIGLEVHQQLESHKLFCKCPSMVNDPNKPDIFFTRKLHLSESELGLKDIAAMYEAEKSKTFFYEACSSSSCLVELDEEPPHEANANAVNAALEIALLLHAKPVDYIQFMRKIVLDGSNVCSFQRTALAATDGYIETSKGKVGIQTICIEEDAAKKLSEDEKSATYRLDRLGVPLIEIATDASIKDAEHAKEAASIIGMILRSTGKAKRGLGTIRQDINLSIKNKPRVELKGFQDLRSIPKVIEAEIKRQLALQEYSSEVRKVNPDFTTSFLRPMPGSARMYPETDHPIIQVTNEMLAGIKLPELLTERAIRLEKEFGINPELALEIADDENYIRLLLGRFKNLKPSTIIHAIVELPKESRSRFNYMPSSNEIEELLDFLNQGKISNDALIKILEDKGKGIFKGMANYKPVDDSLVKVEINDLINKNRHLTPNALMGMIMSRYKGRMDGKKAMELIRELLHS